jgi:tRNA pseudouridine13 synthase
VSKVVTVETLDTMNAQVKAGKQRVALPVVGAKGKLSGGEMGEIEREILGAEGIGDEIRWLNELSRVGGKGGLRAVATPVRDFKIKLVLGNSAQVSFMLLRGCYATVLLREIMKPKDPVAAGF